MGDWGMERGGSMDKVHPQSVTRLLTDIREGRGSRSELLTLVYDDLRQQARQLRRVRRSVDTLQTTALVHEAALRLLKNSDADWKDRAHFLASAAQAMRQILADCARRERAAKRGGGWKRITLYERIGADGGDQADLVALHESLVDLSSLDERMGRVVECRYFAGMSVKEIAHVLSVSVSTVESDWRTARAWLARELRQACAP